jgi:ABC-type Fe3+/spermidine/putrescine transport system ATPase subunit
MTDTGSIGQRSLPGTHEMAAGHAIRVENLRYSYESGASVLHDISLEIEQGEFLTLLGPSGSGKTTLLRILAGMQFPQSGQVYFDGRDVTHVQPNERNVGFVFQNYALFPHMNVFDNVAFGLRMRRLARAEVVQRAQEALAMVDLSDLADRRPNELSGGQQQRVSLARAVAIRPDVLLMDEPLGSLDKRLRQRLQEELRALQRAIGITTVYVTHDQDEAFALSHRVAVMNGGVIEQLASPVDVYRTPASTFVAGFVGDINLLGGRDGGQVGVRPELVSVAKGPRATTGLEGRLESLVFHGRCFRAQVRLPGGALVHADLAPGQVEAFELAEGDDVRVDWPTSEAVALSH